MPEMAFVEAKTTSNENFWLEKNHIDIRIEKY